MRVISQDGKVDFPYEESVISQNGKDITLHSNLIANIHTVIATYSTEAKAIRAMEMLRKYYDNLTFMHLTVGEPQFTAFVARVSEKRFLESTKEYFQFPQNEEIEV